MRSRWVWSRELNRLVPANKRARESFPMVIGDSQEFKVPGTDVVVSGKRARREYMKRNGLEEVGNDKQGLLEEARKAREYHEKRETDQLKRQIGNVCRDREFFRGR